MKNKHHHLFFLLIMKFFSFMKHKSLILTSLFAFALVATTEAQFTLPSKDQKKPSMLDMAKNTLPEAKIKKIVRDIYTNHNEIDFSRSFLALISRIRKADKYEDIGYLDHDILTQAQDDVNVVNVIVVDNQSTKITVKVVTSFDQVLTVKLVLEDGLWKVDNVDNEREKMNSYLRNGTVSYEQPTKQPKPAADKVTQPERPVADSESEVKKVEKSEVAQTPKQPVTEKPSVNDKPVAQKADSVVEKKPANNTKESAKADKSNAKETAKADESNTKESKTTKKADEPKRNQILFESFYSSDEDEESTKDEQENSAKDNKTQSVVTKNIDVKDRITLSPIIDSDSVDEMIYDFIKKVYTDFFIMSDLQLAKKYGTSGFIDQMSQKWEIIDEGQWEYDYCEWTGMAPDPNKDVHIQVDYTGLAASGGGNAVVKIIQNDETVYLTIFFVASDGDNVFEVDSIERE